ncbi:DNA polymerase [Corynebacterium sp. 153RC1]|uniref:DNA polymerase n=1 Tax=unclassified Corynebacterium TaxID=2624378 RepID=UPI00211BA508|nr:MULTISPECIES: DNA polymerase [unclassified Corynebacterium]MCQ9353543.1 DNA polymerase [Corynebacterium sp. 209RC1]MCQ9355764.1 DNA polymerase [Corynebacterium sp. 1222RC1]MCQ9357927.1 DNA polymerase [Corynebacterium sp. 122RC1]MCQ9360121.1 DNA polymerase [Corynebacterium sp. 142RC1]MCQ9362264.1 DNA polymerase [Corynebacterium sp. 153RC1]
MVVDYLSPSPTELRLGVYLTGVRSEERVRAEAKQWFIDVVGVPDEGARPWSSKLGKQALAAYIGSHGAVVPLTDKGDVATSKDAMAQLVADNPHSPELAELADKLLVVGQTNSPAANVQSNLRDGRVYPSIQPDQATGRLSTRDPALTTFGSREERLLKRRSMVLPDEGEVLISVDLSQIDARCMAAGAGDKAYAALFAEGRDSHTEMAVRVFGDPARRSDAKALGHATNYGMGAQGFAKYAGITVEQAQYQQALLRQEFPGLELFKKHLREEAKLNGYVTTAFGRWVPVDVEKYYTQAPAAFGQGTARDVFLEGVLALPAEIADMIRIFVHDEIVLSVSPERAEEIKQLVMDTFKSVQLPCAPGVHVPVLADSAGPGENWAECK